VCPPGMSNDGYRGCIDTNECETNYPCPGRVGLESYCVDHDPPEMFTCGCHTGFESMYAPWDDTLLVECAASGAVAVDVQSFGLSGVSADTDLDALTAKITQDIIDSFSAGTKRNRRLQDSSCSEELVLQSLKVQVDFDPCTTVCIVATISRVTGIEFICNGKVVEDIAAIKVLVKESALKEAVAVLPPSAKEGVLASVEEVTPGGTSSIIIEVIPVTEPPSPSFTMSPSL